MRKLIVSKKTFCEMLSGLVASGVSFESEENAQGNIYIEFTGGY